MKNILDDENVQFRLKFVLQIEDKSIAQAAREADVDWRTMKRWYANFKKGGVNGLFNKPRGRSQPVDEEVKQKLLEYKVDKRSRSGRKIRDLLKKNDGVIVNRQTVWRILKDAGENKRVKKNVKVYLSDDQIRTIVVRIVDYSLNTQYVANQFGISRRRI